MNDLEFVTLRQEFSPDYTLGEMLANGKHFGFTCEDQDRRLEEGNEKVFTKTAIPRGTYRVILSPSRRFGKVMLELLGVPAFTGIRVHGLNNASQTEGCIGLGAKRTADGVRDCAAVNLLLIRMVGECIAQGGKCWMTVI